MIDAGSLSRLALFADLPSPELQAVAETMEEDSFARGTRVLREGLSANVFYVITDGEASVVIEGSERARLRAGDFFGEVAIFTGDAAGADVVAASEELRCAVLPGPQLKPLLLEYPQVALRMLEVGARRLQSANLWSE
jgi:CRP-like cAMP-binding protein